MAAIKAETLCFMERYAATTLIFTDASKLPSGETAAAIFVPSTTHAHSVRVKNTVSVHSAEVAAVQLAVDWLLQQQAMPATIFTDSLSTISALQSPDSGTKSALLSKLLVSLDKLDTMPTLAWIPGHVGIRGNDIADRTAKSGTAASTVELHTPHELKDELRLIDVYAIDRWQAEYDAHVKGAVHHVLEPQVSVKIKFTAAIRRKETLITRLRLGKCLKNAYLHEIKRHPDGLCAACRQHAETVTHFLLECSVSTIPVKLRTASLALQLEPNLSNFLSNRELQDLIVSLVLPLKRKI
jgi:ribonuclease HI